MNQIVCQRILICGISDLPPRTAGFQACIETRNHALLAQICLQVYYACGLNYFIVISLATLFSWNLFKLVGTSANSTFLHVLRKRDVSIKDFLMIWHISESK